MAAALGYRDLTSLTEDDVARIQRAHLLLAMYNAWQPGVFALSGWDLCGVVTLDPGTIAPLLADGDTRWINRGAHDLMDVAPQAGCSSAGIPRGRSLYGSLAEQLQREDSFASRLREVIAIRNSSGIATARQLSVPDPGSPGVLVMIHQLGDGDFQVTALNFGADTATGVVHAPEFPVGTAVTDMATGEAVATVSRVCSFEVQLEPHQGRSLRLGN